MAPYWASLLLAVGFMLLAQRGVEVGGESVLKKWDARNGRSYMRWGVVASALVFVCLTGFRYGIGQDYFYAYIPYFERVRTGLEQGDLEVGFFALNWLVSRFTNDPTPVFLFCSVLFFGFSYAAVMRESSHPVLSVFLLFGMSYFFIFMNAMRQMTAVAILLFSLRHIEEKKLGSFLACIVFACTFHTSSVLFVLMYWLPKARINISVCLLSVLCFFLFKTQIANFVNSIIAQTSYAGYVGSVFDTGQTGNVIIAMNIVILLFSTIVPRLNGGEYSDRYRLLLWCQLICTLIAILSGAIPLSQRVRWIFSLPSIILLPLAVDSIGNLRIRFLVQASIVILYIVYIAITIGMWNGNNVVPYQCVFFRNGV
ncbi:EpsG family protein [Coriobacteriales bacterium OH1046]|nr:EpsG family protein [Coriobacteriales bacterium OH1046]